MLENWCWEKQVLEKMSSHYETQKPLSGELIEKVIKSRYVNVGLFYLRQLFFANFDLKVHTDQGECGMHSDCGIGLMCVFGLWWCREG